MRRPAATPRRFRRKQALDLRAIDEETERRYGEALPVVMVLETADTSGDDPATFLVRMVRLFVGDEESAALERRIAHKYRAGYDPPAAAKRAMGALGYSWKNGLVRPVAKSKGEGV